MSVAEAWIQGDWIHSHVADQSGKYWIAQTWIYGPVGSAAINTRYWIANGRIWGPADSGNVVTGYYIQDNWIIGPTERLPFVGPSV